MLFGQISFPGFGIGPVEIDPDAFSIGDFAIKWYALFIVTGILFAAWYVYHQGKKLGLLLDDLLDCALYVVFPAIICARLYYVIFKKLENPNLYTTFASWFDIRSGGLAIYGGIIGGAIIALLVLRLKKIRIAPFFDLMAPGVMVAQAIGRWGNFMNIEAHGGETENIFRMGILSGGKEIFVHPTFLYESLWNLVGFAIILILYYKLRLKKFDGQIVLSYFAWYGLGRAWIEGLRTDSLYIGSSGIRVSQLIAILFFIAATATLVFFLIRLKKPWIAPCIYHENAKHYADGIKTIEKYKLKTESQTIDQITNNKEDTDSVQ